MYYIVNEATGQIVDSQEHRPTDKELQSIADYMQCDVYVIRGEHAGLTASCGGALDLDDDIDIPDLDIDID